jgi:hypothetical protein
MRCLWIVILALGASAAHAQNMQAPCRACERAAMPDSARIRMLEELVHQMSDTARIRRLEERVDSLQDLAGRLLGDLGAIQQGMNSFTGGGAKEDAVTQARDVWTLLRKLRDRVCHEQPDCP